MPYIHKFFYRNITQKLMQRCTSQKQVEMFADAIEASANDRTPRVPVNLTYLQGADDIIKFMEKRKQ